MSNEINLDDFREYFPYAPTALSIKECVRLSRTRGLNCPSPILDVGCGDGLFAKLAFQNAEVWGIDIDSREARRAQASRAYEQIVLADITRAKLPDGFFASCLANCSLEHIPDLGAALRNIHRSLKPGAPFYTFLPNKDWARYMTSTQTLEKLGLTPLSETIQESINSVFKHRHLEDADGWRRHFESAGFVVDAVEPIGSTASTRAFEAFLLPSTLGWLNKRLTGRWSLSSELRKWTVLPAYALVRLALAVAKDETPTAEFLLACHKPKA